MPSERRQLAVRLSQPASDLFDDVTARASAALGTSLNQAQVIELALRALSEKYPAEEPEPKPKGRK